ncbi:small RNA 2'-O-methyltransferase [Ziziphus jujuba]|uniref:Small RNA 2'-O-methyltransferase n=1 Tax=Ziziphus jujuba TaxID=326968 RepID=A0ABM3IXR4_ZIZJJ|nr:small RNA 2'-O-methyltransferase [Ziziphus jujuba]
METGGYPAVAMQKPTLTPKAVIKKRFGDQACYKVEEVVESTEIGCPGLAITQKGPCLYRCSLQLPEVSVVSGTFKKKKEAEQSASELALEKLGIHLTENNPTSEESWDDVVARLKYLFSNEFLKSLHPLSGHLRAALQREGDHCGWIPVSLITICDSKIYNLCKSIDPKVESNPFLVISYVMRAAASLSEVVCTSEGKLWIRRQIQYPHEIIDSVIPKPGSSESFLIRAISIPCLQEKSVEVLNLNVSSTGYYLDFIANQLGLVDASNILVSRPIGKASSETRLYFTAPQSYLLELSSDYLNAKEVIACEGSFNERASYLSGEDIYGDAILASIGYTWKSMDLFHEDLSLQSYYRIILGKIPGGVYKLSRGAILAAELPLAYTTKTNWRGSFPREILCTFCRRHRLSEPVFSTIRTSEAMTSGLNKNLKVNESAVEETQHASGCIVATGAKEEVESGGTFRCEVKIYSKFQDLIIECSPKDSYKRPPDSIQNASLKVLLWLNMYFMNPDMPAERLNCSATELNIQFYPQHLMKAFGLYQSVQNFWHSEIQGGILLQSNRMNMPHTMLGHGIGSFNIEGPDSGVSASNGCLSCISYSVSLLTEGENTKELLESTDEFEFEIGSVSVISHLETVVTQMTVGQSAFFCMDLPPKELILAATDDCERVVPMLASRTCCLEYTITLLRVTEPLEDRMEQALFSPPLSKQRVGFAVQHIKESGATTLVDFGCGAGSLLDSLLNYETSLEKIVGVDISNKSLVRAAKVLHTKLSKKSDADVPFAELKSLVLYDGSILDFDSRLYGFDIGTCLEVIEHMEEDQACLFGDIVLSSFLPRILIVSTPNYEYNVILQKSSLSSQEEDPDDKTQSQSCKFRNHDHKFEWTREQFNHWATELAARHNYSVEFSGVGGSGDLEPGFASQIAVFRRRYPLQGDDLLKDTDIERQYDVVWEWNGGTRSRSAL